MKVLFSASTRELELSGTGQEFLRLSRDLRSADSAFSLFEDPDPHPYETALRRMEIRQAVGKVKIHVPADGVLEIGGDSDSMAFLAENIEDFAVSASGSYHWHVEHFPGHEYLDEASVPLVVMIDGSGES
ncbi:hypothetical protein ACFWEJ_16900 [Promicromonospora sp. NPDC060204]|uniref:Imm32 family immunity protein n=1 Tax=Promicromonospora sp. NPDC060204 TaxID=3347071 RepID=UPI00364A0025